MFHWTQTIWGQILHFILMNLCQCLDLCSGKFPSKAIPGVRYSIVTVAGCPPETLTLFLFLLLNFSEILFYRCIQPGESDHLKEYSLTYLGSYSVF